MLYTAQGVLDQIAKGYGGLWATADRYEEAVRESYLSGIRVALERVDPTGRAAKQLRDLLDQEAAK